HGEALLEVPTEEDALPVAAPPGVRVTWLARNGVPHGERLIPEMRATVRRLLGNQVPAHDTDLEDVDVDNDTLWEVPEPVAEVSQFYAWLAGEAAVIKTLR